VLSAPTPKRERRSKEPIQRSGLQKLKPAPWKAQVRHVQKERKKERKKPKRTGLKAGHYKDFIGVGSLCFENG
jgi:hypothetical protein